MNFSKKYFRYLIMNFAACCLFLIGTHDLLGQWHTDFTSFQKGEVVYQVVDDACSDLTIWAGVRYAVDGNSNFDQIVLGFNDAKGNILSDPIVFPAQPSSAFEIHEELNLIQVKDPITGKCDGYVLTFSAAQGGGDYKLHYLRLDQNGTIICDVNPLENHGATDIIYDMVQDEDGSILMVGSTYLSGKAELLLLRMDLNCKSINAERHIMMIDPNNEQAIGYDIEMVYNPLFEKDAQYVLSGRIGQYSMMVFAKYDLSISDPIAWDLDADGMRTEKAIKVIELDEEYYIIGEGEDAERRKYTYFVSLTFDEKQQPKINIIRKYYFPSTPNYPTAVTRRWNETGLVISGVIDDDPMSSQKLYHPYLFEINDKGDVVSSTVQHGGHKYGIPYDVITMNEGSYQLAGTAWSDKDFNNRDFVLIDADLKLENRLGCFDQVKSTIEDIKLLLLDVSHDIFPMEPDVAEVYTPVEETEYLQQFCGAQENYSCKEVNFTALIYPSSIGWQYTFLPVINLSVGSVIEHSWEIRDGSNTPIVNAVNGALVYNFSVKDNYTVELEVTAKLPDGKLCFETAILYVTPQWAVVTRD